MCCYSGAETNLKVVGTGPAQGAGQLLWSCPSTFFGSKSTISRFGERFRDGQTARRIEKNVSRSRCERVAGWVDAWVCYFQFSLCAHLICTEATWVDLRAKFSFALLLFRQRHVTHLAHVGCLKLLYAQLLTRSKAQKTRKTLIKRWIFWRINIRTTQL